MLDVKSAESAESCESPAVEIRDDRIRDLTKGSSMLGTFSACLYLPVGYVVNARCPIRVHVALGEHIQDIDS